MRELGVLIHDQFIFGPMGPQQWSLSEFKRLLRWFKGLGWDRAVFLLWPIHNNEEDDFNLLELTGLHGSGIRQRTSFRPGNAYDPDDRYLGTPEGLARAAKIKAAMVYCRQIGLSPWLHFNATHGSPQFCEEHSELLAIDTFDFVAEGVVLCPSKPEAMRHLLERHTKMLRYFDAAEGVYMTFRDGGGCNCSQCQPPSRMLSELATAYFHMIRGIHPRIPVVFASHHVHVNEVPGVARSVPAGMWAAESMRTQSLDVPREQDAARINAWKAEGFYLEGMMAVVENPTAMLPSVYPRRIDRALKFSRDMGLKGLFVGSTLNPYLFPMHWWLLPKLWREGASVDELIRRYFRESFGAASVEPGLRWADAMERAMDLAQAPSQREAGFQKMLVINFAARMLPEKCMREGVPESFRRDATQAASCAREALAAAEELGDAMREFHALDANTIVAGTEVFAQYLAMRAAKIPVLDALHAGDAAAAVRAFAAVESACRDMVDACRNSPNTDILATHWRRLELLPARLAALKRLLPELAEKKCFRSVLMPLEMAEQSWAKKAT